MQFLQPPPRHVRQVRCILSPQQGNGGTCASGCTSAFLTWWRKPDGKYCLRICSGTDQTSPFRTGTEQIGLAPNDDTSSRGVRERKGRFGREEKLSSQSRTHVLGSIALLKHRGPLNFKDELSWRLVIATGNRLLHHTSHSADELTAVDAIVDIWGHGNVKRPKGPSVEADTLAFRLSQLRLMVTAENSLNLQTIIALATDIASQCAIWHSALSSTWRPISIPTYTLAPSI